MTYVKNRLRRTMMFVPGNNPAMIAQQINLFIIFNFARLPDIRNKLVP